MSQQELFQLPVVPPKYRNFPTKEIDTFIPSARRSQIAPTSNMIASIRRFGILEPILVMETARPNVYELAAGRGRIACAKIVGLEEIPARIFPRGWSRAEVLTLVENEIRRRNPLAEWKAIKRLMDRGASEQEIMEETGVSAQKLGQLLTLDFLIPELKEAFEKGEIKPSTALMAAKQRGKMQRRLSKKLEQEGRLRVSDIAVVRKEAKNDAVKNLPLDIFVEKDWRTSALTRAQGLRQVLPGNAPKELKETLNKFISLLEKK